MYNLLLLDIVLNIRLLQLDCHRHKLLQQQFKASHFHIDLYKLRVHSQHLYMNKEFQQYRSQSTRLQQHYYHHHKLLNLKLQVYRFHRLINKLKVLELG